MYGAFLLRAVMTLLRVDSPMLIPTPSVNLFPTAWVLFGFSDPARSTRLIFLVTVEPSAMFLLIRLMVNIAWDRLLLLFMEVDSVERILKPLQRSSTASDTSVTTTSVSCTTLKTGW